MNLMDKAYNLYEKVKEAINDNKSLDWFKSEGKIIYLTEGSSIDEMLATDANGSGIPSFVYWDYFVVKGNPKVSYLGEKQIDEIREIYYNFTFSKGDALLIYRNGNSLLYICE